MFRCLILKLSTLNLHLFTFKLQSKGLNERVALASENSTKLLQDVRTTLEQVQGGFEKLLKNSKDDFNKISNQKNQIIDRENEIIK